MSHSHYYFKGRSVPPADGLTEEEEEAGWQNTLEQLQRIAPRAPSEVLKKALEEVWDPENPPESIRRVIHDPYFAEEYGSPWYTALFELTEILPHAGESSRNEIIEALQRHWNPDDLQKSIDKAYQQLTGSSTWVT